MRKLLILASLMLIDLDARNVISNALLKNDQQAYAYCLADKHSFVAVVWPIAQGKDQELEQLFNHYGKIKYKKMPILLARMRAIFCI